MTTTPNNRRGRCRVCHRWQNTGPDGRVLAHADPDLPGFACDGEARQPIERLSDYDVAAR